MIGCGAAVSRGGAGIASCCGACARPIGDRYLLRVGDVSYHERCLACSACGSPLQHTCYTRHAKLYCRIDYDRYLFVTTYVSDGMQRNGLATDPDVHTTIVVNFTVQSPGDVLTVALFKRGSVGDFFFC